MLEPTITFSSLLLSKATTGAEISLTTVSRDVDGTSSLLDNSDSSVGICEDVCSAIDPLLSDCNC